MGTDARATARERLRRELFEAAHEVSPTKRLSYLEERAGGDRDLLDSVLRLLAAEAIDTGILDYSPCRRNQSELRSAPLMFGPYRALRRIGEGGMGTVFVCTKGGEEQLVAAKVIRSAFPMTEFREGFDQERRILTTLRHANICHLIDAGIAEGEPFFIMEYVEGQPIDKFCRHRRCSISDRLVLVTQVLAAMEYLHGQNVVHRDLKPSNILVTEDGVVKILDFGIAKIVAHPLGMTGLKPTSSRNAAMTLRYASPEQLHRTLSGRSSDLYTLGVVAYELLTGRHPYERELKKGVSHLIRAQTTRRPAAASLVNDPEDDSGLPSQLREFPIRFRAAIDQLLFNALASEPLRRYRTATQFLDDVRFCLEGRAISPLKPAHN